MIDDARALATEIAAQATEMINEAFDVDIDVHHKSDESPVTETDIAINRLVMDAVSDKFPDHGFIGEELGSHGTDREHVWVCDPIDGTRAFTLGFPISTFALALLRDGDPVLSVVAYPARRWTYVAQKGQGVTLNGRPIHVNDAHEIVGGVVDTNSPLRYDKHTPTIFDGLNQAGAVTISYGSVVVTATSIARGALVGAVFSGANPWDAAASKLIVEEAGGRFTDVGGNEQRYDRPIRGYVASNGHVHDELLAIVERCGITIREPSMR